MTDIVLVPVTGGSNLSAINSNFDKIEEAVNTDVLHLKGGNNVMKQDLDLNGNQLLNHETDLTNPDSLINVGDADARYYNVSGDALAGNMNAAGNKILNLPVANAPHEPMRKNEVDAANAAQDAVTATNNSKTVRTPEAIPALGNAASRADKLLSFDNSGNPVAIAAANQSATDLELRLANSADPTKGASLVGWTRSALSDKINNVHRMLDAQERNIWEFADLVTSKPVPNDPSTWDWYPAMVAAHALGNVEYPSGTFKCSGTVAVMPGSKLQGAKGGRFGDLTLRTVIESTTATIPLFDQISTATGQVDGFRAYDVVLISDLPVRLNDPATTISSGGPSPFIMRPEFRRVSFQKKTAATGTGLLMSKCFDYIVEQCDFDGFARCLVIQGCDLGRVANNRFTSIGEYGILELSTGTFGSQNQIEHNDMVQAAPGATYIKSTSRHARLRDNYMEQQSGAFLGFIDLSPTSVPQYGANVVSTTRLLSVEVDQNRLDGHSLATGFVYRLIGSGHTNVKIHDVGTSGAAPTMDWLLIENTGGLSPRFNGTNHSKYDISGGRGNDGGQIYLFKSKPLLKTPKGIYVDVESFSSLRRNELERTTAITNVTLDRRGIRLGAAIGTTLLHCVLPAADGLNNPFLRDTVVYNVTVVARAVGGSEALRIIKVVDAAQVDAVIDTTLGQQSQRIAFTFTGRPTANTVGLALRFVSATPTFPIIVESMSFEES